MSALFMASFPVAVSILRLELYSAFLGVGSSEQAVFLTL